MTQVAERSQGTPLTNEVPGGTWIQPVHIDPKLPPVYVVDPEHVKRLIMDGARIVADPRDPHAVQPVQPEPADVEALKAANEALRRELEELRAKAAQDFGSGAKRR